MPILTVGLVNTSSDYLGHVKYALTFLSEDVVSYRIDEAKGDIEIEFVAGVDPEPMRARVQQLLERYDQTKFGLKSIVHLDQRRNLPPIDSWAGMLERRWVTPVGEGHVILRGPAAQLMALIDYKVQTIFAKEFHAEVEIFPATIRSESLQRCNHFSSFPEHVDFVAHLKQDLDVLSGFAKACREEGWSPGLHERRMGVNDFALSPSCCYHAYEGMEGWDLEKPGRCVTATLHCHRYEGANLKSMSRLRAFTMREVIWVGQPAYVTSCRARAEELIQQWAKDWELSCTFETGNDMFFTDDFAVKASFQRQQEAKRELRLDLPSEGCAISVFSSNFHATTFGKAFDIKVDGRTAVSACVGWGYERWIYALISQFGFEIERWPVRLNCEFEEFTAREARR